MFSITLHMAIYVYNMSKYYLHTCPQNSGCPLFARAAELPLWSTPPSRSTLNTAANAVRRIHKFSVVNYVEKSMDAYLSFKITSADMDS